MNKFNVTAATAAIIAVMTLASCGTSKKAATADSLDDAGITSQGNAPVTAAVRELTFLQKVSDNAVYCKDITSKIDLTLTTDDKVMTVAGTLRMRKDSVIRIQLTPMGIMEIGRIEFRSDSVLVMDRINKEYVMACYDDLPFLKRNGIDFYTLQSLFWNELFLPGEQKVKESKLREFDVEFNDNASNATSIPVTYSTGKLDFKWMADETTGQIRSLDVAYNSSEHGTTTLTCGYSAFTPVGVKMFPTCITMGVNTSATGQERGGSLTLRLKGIDTEGGWDTYTTVSSKYKKANASTIISKLSGR